MCVYNYRYTHIQFTYIIHIYIYNILKIFLSKRNLHLSPSSANSISYKPWVTSSTSFISVSFLSNKEDNSLKYCCEEGVYTDGINSKYCRSEK